MTIIHEIENERQTIARLKRHLQLEQVKKRKADTRRKIELGGLVIKAKLNRYTKAIILGALLHAVEKLEKDKSIKTFYQAKGSKAFVNQEENRRDR